MTTLKPAEIIKVVANANREYTDSAVFLDHIGNRSLSTTFERAFALLRKLSADELRLTGHEPYQLLCDGLYDLWLEARS